MIGDRFQMDIADGLQRIGRFLRCFHVSACSAIFLPRLWQQWVIFRGAFHLAIRHGPTSPAF